MNKKTVLAAAIAAAVVPVVANAATYEATLTQVLLYSNGSTSGLSGNITSSSATFSYDDVTNLLTQTAGIFNVRFNAGPQTLYRTSITGLIIGNGAAASASTFICTEGNFGPGVGASVCGGYHFGGNFINESTTSWGPGTAVSRTIGGDDGLGGTPQQSITSLDGMNTITWMGTTLVLANKTCTGTCTNTAAGSNNGQQWTFSVVPVPAAVWLFGSAVVMMGWTRRKAAA